MSGAAAVLSELFLSPAAVAANNNKVGWEYVLLLWSPEQRVNRGQRMMTAPLAATAGQHLLARSVRIKKEEEEEEGTKALMQRRSL
jgi:hypothetical protein